MGRGKSSENLENKFTEKPTGRQIEPRNTRKWPVGTF